MMLRNLMSLLEILMPLVAMIAIFGLLCKILMNIYTKFTLIIYIMDLIMLIV